MLVMASEKVAKVAKKYCCNKCDLETYNKYNFEKHLQSKKHNASKNASNASNKYFKCICDKEFTHDSSYYRHKRICKKSKKKNHNSKFRNHC